MPRGRPAKGTTKNGQPAKVSEEAGTTPVKAPAVEPEQGSRSSMRLRGQSKVADNKENVVTEPKKKPGRKRKAASAAEEKPEESTVPDVKEDEAVKEEEAAKEEPKAVPEEEEPEKDVPTDDSQPSKASQEGEIKVNRAPVLTMWVAAVAERQGFTFDEAVTFGKAISGLFAQSKGKRIGVFEESSKDPEVETNKKKAKKEKFDVFGNSVYGKTTEKGRFAVESGKAIVPNTVKAYLHRAFKDDYDRVREAFEALANSLEPEEIGSKAYNLYEKFRPVVPDGARGWGAHGVLDLKHVQALAASG